MAQHGLHIVDTSLSVTDALDRLEAIAIAHGLTVFAKNVAGLAALVAEAAQEDSAPAGVTAAGVAQSTGAGEYQ